MRQNISSGTKWEKIAGYSRAVRVGQMVYVSGTTAIDEDGQVVGLDDVYAQSHFILGKIQQALEAAGASMADVVRTRIYLTQIARWEEAARAHAEYFGDVLPTNTLIGIDALVGAGYLVEIEAEAIIGAGDDGAI
ncbi:MAG: RidA family protein [Anaerolineaceae bacterium]|nr:MAG: RidA family protein [Anaerolineaceae bacterium]